MSRKLVGWGLFDSGNGSYAKVANTMENIDFYSIGLDKENKNDHFININLADYSWKYGNNQMFDELDKLPKPHFILASPPCESWSVASSMRGGNASWKQEQGDALFAPQIPLSKFTIRSYKDYLHENVQFKYELSFINRINGELCTYNTIKIIERYKPKVYVIENPATSKMWEYIETIIGIDIPFENQCNYGNYDYPIRKPTKFKSNIDLGLDNTPFQNEIPWEEFRGYNNRSNIPPKLVKDILEKTTKEIKNDTINQPS